MCAYFALELSSQNKKFFFEKSHRSVQRFDLSEQRQREDIHHIDAHTEQRELGFLRGDLDCLPNTSPSRHDLRRDDAPTPMAHQTHKSLSPDTTSHSPRAPRELFISIFFFFIVRASVERVRLVLLTASVAHYSCWQSVAEGAAQLTLLWAQSPSQRFFVLRRSFKRPLCSDAQFVSQLLFVSHVTC